MLECPFTRVTVTAISRFHISVRWPWAEPDPAPGGIDWNGDFAIPTPGSREARRLYYRTEPTADRLRAGDTCLVGIPPTVVHVVATHHFDPPLVTGMLPRPASLLEVLPQGESHTPESESEEQEFAIDPAGGEPIRLELLLRPYAFLAAGDEVADRRGRAWRFDGPWAWSPFDHDRPRTPTWPLTLLARDGEPTPEQTADVALATATGSHTQELWRWTELTQAEPTSPPPDD
ncbi:hypothetical protein [Kitasatospora purpeofusca]|uniref:hypothetical protein n=1 Tax=Kitasatospora purpeofusca TaxID=67352 RepID=UPI0007C56134|nr:hypothetical protein [Kitasatospora purpeofusca]